MSCRGIRFFPGVPFCFLIHPIKKIVCLFSRLLNGTVFLTTIQLEAWVPEPLREEFPLLISDAIPSPLNNVRPEVCGPSLTSSTCRSFGHYFIESFRVVGR